MTKDWPLDLPEDAMRAMVDASMDRIEAFMATLSEQAVDRSAEADPEYISSLKEPMPELGGDFGQLLDMVFHDLAPLSLNPASPGFMGYVPGGGIFHAALADLISNTLNRYTGVAGVAPALNQLEANVVRWFCQIMGYPAQARGFLTSGGSLANWSALVTARHARLGEDFSRGMIYTSDQAHHCVAKAARLAGFPAANVRVLPADADYRLNPVRVRDAIQNDRARGLQPAILVASAGTTNSGAVDPLPELAALAQEENLWLHVDAAYGGFFRLTGRGKQALAGIELADSLVLDPHKTLFLPYGTGALLVRDGSALKAVHSSSADYMPAMQEDEDLMDLCELSPELTRPFRGLRVWLPFKLHGVGVFRRYLDEKLDLARWIEAEIRKIPQLEILAPATLSILAFAVRDEGQSLAERNSDTRALMRHINDKQRVNLTGTLLKDVFAIRIAVVAFRLHQERMNMLLEDLKGALAAMGAE
ncbi:MAG TPA: aminotransferase class V-fold PLP-dependent enzyme [Xanthomonadales bacterium]|nr:aminotransferase class V-fold PLP-dependent enzyme [Xanthomonadales bacterium]